jgi:ABC-type uncharacterized transport system substrate-binding protein
MKKKLFALALAACMTLSLAACGSSSAPSTAAASAAASAATSGSAATSAASTSAGKTYSIGICQLVQHPALDAATQGFEDALKEKLGDAVTFDLQNAAGDTAGLRHHLLRLCRQQGGSDHGQRHARPCRLPRPPPTPSPFWAPPSPTTPPL